MTLAMSPYHVLSTPHLVALSTHPALSPSIDDLPRPEVTFVCLFIVCLPSHTPPLTLAHQLLDTRSALFTVTQGQGAWHRADPR